MGGVTHVFYVTILAVLASANPPTYMDLQESWSQDFGPNLYPKIVPVSEKVTRNNPPSYYRLPGTSVPEEYNLTLVVDPEKESYSGATRIRIRMLEDTDTIVLHMFQYDRDNHPRIAVTDSRGGLIVTGAEHSEDDRNFLTIKSLENRTLTKGEMYYLDINFERMFESARSLRGLYKSSYTNDQGDKRYLATTQFEATDARTAFPCYDEPALKAIFNIHIYHPNGYRAITNMDVISSEQPPINNFNVTSFRPTPRMSTYLLAFVISDFEYKSNYRDGNVLYTKEYRVYARPNVQDQLDFPLDFGQRTIKYQEQYTEVDYRLPKMDNVAIPDFAAGAMENWGLVTYREEYLIYKKGVSSYEDELSIALVMSHETAHFWFGDEVSPSWWDYVWLNEGFATFFQFYATDKVFDSEWRLMEQFTVTQLQTVMVQDSFPGTVSMSHKVGSPAEIGSKFNGISYSKAGSVIRMMYHVLGESLFRSAMSTYLKSLPTGVSEPELLFSAIQDVIEDEEVIPTSTDMSAVFGSWSNQAGYPIITITPNIDSKTLIVTQERFHFDKSESTNEKWWIPFTWTTSNDPSFTILKSTMIPPDATSFNVTYEPSSWYIANLQQMGYFRVMYDDENWKNLIDALNMENHTVIHPLNKAQLIDDSFVFARSERCTYTTTMSIVNYLQRELDFIPWMSGSRGLTFLKYRMPASKMYDRYNRFVRRTVSRMYHSVGFEGQQSDKYVTKRTRTIASTIACDHGSVECRGSARSVVYAEIYNVSSVDPDIEDVAYCNSVRGANNTRAWNHLLEEYKKTGDVNVQDDNRRSSRAKTLLAAMACTDDEEKIDSYLAMTIDENGPISMFAKDDVVQYMILNGGPLSILKVLNFMTNNYSELRESMPSRTSMYYIIYILGTVIVTDEQIDAFNAFTSKQLNNFSRTERRIINISKANIDRNQVWISKNMGDIESWLMENA